jgi:hypothetical protein
MARGATIVLLAALVIAGVSKVGAAEGAGTLFRVFDGTFYKGKPDLVALGVEPARLIYEGALFARGSRADAMPSVTAVEKTALQAAAASGVNVLDVERWNDLADAPARYVALLRQLRAINPSYKTGYYSVVPKRDYWGATAGQGSAKYIAWQRENDRLQPVADETNYLFPSLYTFYDDPVGWVKYAEANIAEARRLAKGKPVYAFLWPQYHESNWLLRGRPIPGKFWRLQLDTVRRLADGVVIWGGYKQNWNPDAEWWLETKRFLASDKPVGKSR